jgi:hypothetical protein
MRVLLNIVLSLLMTSCSAESYNPEAAVEIHAATSFQLGLIETTKSFGQQNGFSVHAGNKLVRDGRNVLQVIMERGDGVLMTMSNFMREDVFDAAFYAKKPDADWRAVKAAWLEEMRVALNGRGEIIEVPVRPPPSLVEQERKRREAAKPEDR